MTRNLILLLTGSTLALTACGPYGDRYDDGGSMKAVTQLQCPDHEGSLTRVRVATDGQSCDYAGPRGSEVVLKLVKVGGDATPTLDGLDAQINQLMPEVRGKVDRGDKTLKDRDAAPSGSSSNSRERVDINLPGFHVHTRGDRAEIRMPGISVDADDNHHGEGSGHEGAAHVRVAGGLVDVRAYDDAAIVRMRERGHGVRAGYRLADKEASPTGWRLAGYEARGPASGPIVVALVKSKDPEQDPLFQDAHRLIRANVGG